MRLETRSGLARWNRSALQEDRENTEDTGSIALMGVSGKLVTRQVGTVWVLKLLLDRKGQLDLDYQVNIVHPKMVIDGMNCINTTLNDGSVIIIQICCCLLLEARACLS